MVRRRPNAREKKTQSAGGFEPLICTSSVPAVNHSTIWLHDEDGCILLFYSQARDIRCIRCSPRIVYSPPRLFAAYSCIRRLFVYSPRIRLFAAYSFIHERFAVFVHSRTIRLFPGYSLYSCWTNDSLIDEWFVAPTLTNQIIRKIRYSQVSGNDMLNKWRTQEIENAASKTEKVKKINEPLKTLSG